MATLSHCQLKLLEIEAIGTPVRKPHDGDLFISLDIITAAWKSFRCGRQTKAALDFYFIDQYPLMQVQSLHRASSVMDGSKLT